MKVWHKAGDYWRRGLRISDALPDMVPMTKITRLDDGSWIAIFPKDMNLLTTTNLTNETNDESAEEVTTNNTDEMDNIEPARNQGEPKQLDLFAFQQLQQENEHLRLQLSQQQAQPRTRRQRQPRKPAAVRPSHSVCPAIPLQEDNHDRQNLLKAIGMVAAATVALFVIYETGLLIPLGLIGLATGGILK